MVLCLIVVAVLLLAVVLFFFLIFPSCRRHPHRLLLKERMIAHRGLYDAKQGIPENSLAAFRKAVEGGFAIETDVHLSVDGEVILFHDDSLLRLCGVDAAPEQLTLAELKQLRLSDTEHTIPTLREGLQEINGRVPLLIECKCFTVKNCRELCQAVDAILQEYSGDCLIQSFYPPVLRWFRKHAPQVCRGQLASAFPGDRIIKQMLGCMVFNFLSRPDFISYEYPYAAHPCFRFCIRLGALPVGWTFRSQEEIETYRSFFSAFIFEGFLPKEKGE